MQNASLQAFMESIPDAFLAEKAGDLEASVVLDVGDEAWSLLIKNGACRLQEGDLPNADLRLQASEKDLLRLFKGELNPMFAFTTRKLRLKGDVNLAMRLIQYFDLV